MGFPIPWEQVRRRIVPSPANDFSRQAWAAAPRGRPGGFSRSYGKERCGAALRGHARDDISRIRNSLDSVRVFIEETANFDQQPP